MDNEYVKAPEKKYVSKGWGYEEWLCNNDLYCGKKLHFWKGKRCSWHYHLEKEETFWVIKGRILVYHSMDDCMDKNGFDAKLANSIELDVGDTFHVVPCMRHMIVGLVESDLVEFSTRHFEKDSYRLQKGN